MPPSTYQPTQEQLKIVGHDGPAFVTACPGAGKTRTMVARAQQLLFDPDDRRGVAFLSFTNAAVDELQTRLNAFGTLPNPLFPSYIGTFDRFLWQFIITPFGIPGCSTQPRLIPDKSGWEVKPGFENSQTLPLGCFDRVSGEAIPAAALAAGFDTSTRNIKTHETIARKILANALTNGMVDFDDIRVAIEHHFSDPKLEKRLGIALSARFREVIVDEAQDCNPADLKIIKRLQKAGIPVKVICDPDQSIYGFRGGVTDEFKTFAGDFKVDENLPMTGNFRSTPAICKAIAAVRPSAPLGPADEPLGEFKDDATPIHIISYGGQGVASGIGAKFKSLVEDLNINLSDAVVLASTWQSCAKAIGQAYVDPKSNMTLSLARAIMDFHFAFALGGLRDALTSLHATMLWIQGHLATRGDYHRYVQENGLDDGGWRPSVIDLARQLEYKPADGAMAWLIKARNALAENYVAATNINSRLKMSTDLPKALAAAPTQSCPSRTIHSAKGLEFPAVCVVMTAQKAGKILDLLEGAKLPDLEEDARKIYVAVSRAKQLLTIAIPASQATRLRDHLQKSGTAVVLHQL